MGWFLWIVFLALLVVAVAHWLHFNLTKPLPGPWGVPVLFNLPQALYHNWKEDALLDVVAGHEKFGRSYMVRIPPMTIVFSTHPEDVSHVLKDNFDNWVKSSVLAALFEELFGRGIFVVNGEDWLLQRKSASHAFRVKDIERSLEVFARVSRDVVRELDARAGGEADVLPLLESVRKCSVFPAVVVTLLLLGLVRRR